MKSLIVANWKMNPVTLAEAKGIFNSVERGIRTAKKVEVVICPPFVWLAYLLNPKPYTLNPKLGAQNVFWEKKGAFTGEVSPMMVKDLGCQYVIVGHSERRRYFAETDEMINKKIKAAIVAKLKPIFCIGETKEERKKGETINRLKSQIEKGLNKITKKEIKSLSIAYEPIWAIGTGNPCEVDEAQSMGLLIRKIIAQLYKSPTISNRLPILYGGSVNSKNATGYIKEAKMQGLLVGGASLDPQEFIKIIQNVTTEKLSQ